MPSKLDQDRGHHLPRQRRRETNGPAYDASLLGLSSHGPERTVGRRAATLDALRSTGADAGSRRHLLVERRASSRAAKGKGLIEIRGETGTPVLAQAARRRARRHHCIMASRLLAKELNRYLHHHK